MPATATARKFHYCSISSVASTVPYLPELGCSEYLEYRDQLQADQARHQQPRCRLHIARATMRALVSLLPACTRGGGAKRRRRRGTGLSLPELLRGERSLGPYACTSAAGFEPPADWLVSPRLAHGSNSPGPGFRGAGRLTAPAPGIVAPSY
jgi:hypothetical protein